MLMLANYYLDMEDYVANIQFSSIYFSRKHLIEYALHVLFYLLVLYVTESSISFINLNGAFI